MAVLPGEVRRTKEATFVHKGKEYQVDFLDARRTGFIELPDGTLLGELSWHLMFVDTLTDWKEVSKDTNRSGIRAREC